MRAVRIASTINRAHIQQQRPRSEVAPAVLTKQRLAALRRRCMDIQHNGRGFGGASVIATTGRVDNPTRVHPSAFPSHISLG